MISEQRTYVIGDIQGCYDPLMRLLDRVHFDPTQDRLALVGDVVNRGPQSLAVLRFLHQLPHVSLVLGNHDVFLLILGYGFVPEGNYTHTLQPVLEAHDRMILFEWLRHQPFLTTLPHAAENKPVVMVHAGIPPQWRISEAQQLARELEQALQGPHFSEVLNTLFGDIPATWNPHLCGIERLRYIANAFTRMRFCTPRGELDLVSDGYESQPEPAFLPWFTFRDPDQDQCLITFGHWSALKGACDTSHCLALDTGCAWGHTLTAWCVETGIRTSVGYHA
ncbi:MAG: bis(5'-nucleosyl)-tetraphosphatase (symmetrical) [Gammaproteobacteria bacterium RIFCSPHIGHO2_12_FULL_45_9]|nr:MAG: bis(5'-nucleosyl)-tetraphosphatase (symmetrical) [Gammaproteobacteria bacterium RIFCSPHIGHO2_12_FULL_45_9]